MNKTETHVVEIEEHDFDYGVSIIGTAFFDSQSSAFEFINEHNSEQLEYVEQDPSYCTFARYKGKYNA